MHKNHTSSSHSAFKQFLLLLSLLIGLYGTAQAQHLTNSIPNSPLTYSDAEFDFSLSVPAEYVTHLRDADLLGSVVSFESVHAEHMTETDHHASTPKFAVGSYFVEWTGETSLDEWTTQYSNQVGRPDTVDANESREIVIVDDHHAIKVSGETHYGRYQFVNIVRGNAVWFISANGEMATSEFDAIVDSFEFGSNAPLTLRDIHGHNFQPLPLNRIDTSLQQFITKSFFVPSYLRVPVSGNASCNSSAHTGASSYAVDVGLNEGTSAYASQEGSVFVGWYPNSWGNLLIITTPSWAGSYDIYYAHLQGYDEDVLHSAPFYYVYKNERVGFTGNTGNSTGPHLHFEVRNSAGQGQSLVGMTGFTAYSSYPGGSGCANLSR